MVTIRKQAIHRDVTSTDVHGQPCMPVTRVAGRGVLANLLAGRFVENLTPLFVIGRAVGDATASELAGLLPGPAAS